MLNRRERFERSVRSELVLRANVLYHEGENKEYENRQADMISAEMPFVRSFAEEFLRVGRPITCLDYGCGTGLVSLAIAPILKPADTLICTDISSAMLDICMENLRKQNFPFRLESRVTEGLVIPADDNSLDAIMINSVLHHLPDLSAFARECWRTLKPDGVLIVSHEPNGDQKTVFSARLLIGFLEMVFRPATLIFALAERSRFIETALRIVSGRTLSKYRRRNAMLDDIADALQKEGLADKRLSGMEIQWLVDFHTGKGFKKDTLMQDVFSSFSLLRWESYGHLGALNAKSRIRRKLDHYLKKRYPSAGSALRFALAKRTAQKK